MNPHDQRIIHSSEDPNWRTPRSCFVALQREFRFLVDGAASTDNRVCASWMGPGSVTPDALAADWVVVCRSATEYDDDPLTLFLNPPYSRKMAATLKAAGNPSHVGYRIEHWAKKCWEESQRGCTIVGLFPFAPQTTWYRQYVMGHSGNEALPQVKDGATAHHWSGHAAREERRLPHRISFLRPDGSPAANAGVNTAVIVWTPNYGIVGPWQPWTYYWSYR